MASSSTTSALAFAGLAAASLFGAAARKYKWVFGSTEAAAPAEALPAMEQAAFFEYVDSHADDYVERLGECVAMDGVSADVAKWPEIVRTVHWVKDWLLKLGGEVLV